MAILDLNTHSLAYDHIEGKGPCVIFCAGFRSNRFGNKAQRLMAMCRELELEYICFDYRGHGESSGDFADGNISAWLQDTLAIIEKVAQNKMVVLVGSSMGGWLALLAALAQPAKVKGLLLIACAADMTRYYPKRIQGLAKQQDEQSRCYYAVPNSYDDQEPYRIYEQLMLDGEQWCLLDKPIKLTIPVRLLHGALDDVVEWQRSQSVMEKLASDEVTLTLVKTGNHRLSDEGDLILLRRLLREMVELLLAEGAV